MAELIPMERYPFEGETRAAVDAFHVWKDRVLDLAVDHPAESLFVVLSSGALIFYLAEKPVNEDVRTYNDALHYISTCLSVGYARIYPQTQIGKLVATVVMAIGPSLTSWVIEGRLVGRTTPAPPGPDLTPVLQRLDAILEELKAQRAAAGN
jgi:hypothetical protein